MNWERIEMVIYANLITLVGLGILLGIVVLNKLFDQRQRKIFLYAVAGNIFVILWIITDFLYMGVGTQEAVIVRRLASFVNFAASPIVPILLATVFSNRRRKFRYYLPVAINIVICLISTFYPLVFFITLKNGYQRGFLFLFPIAVALLYTVILLFEPSARHRRAQRQERIFLILVIFLLVCAMTLEILLRMSFMLWNMAGLSLILYYLLLNVNYFTLDSLTGCYNRMAYNWTISAIEGKRNCIITTMDLNGLKQVNDTAGHAEGDRLLLRFATIIIENTSSSSDLYRIGGDEFVLITKKEKLSKYYSGMEKVLMAAENEEISFARGEVEYLPEQLIEDVIALADERMYDMKKKMKKANLTSVFSK